MVNIIKNSRIFHTALFVWALFIPAMFFLDKKDVFVFSGALAFLSSLSVLVAYYPAMKLALKHDRDHFDYVDFLTLGIMCSWTALAGRLGYVLYLRYTYDVPEELSGYFLAFLQYLAFTGAILHLSARRVIKNHAPTSSVPWVLFTVVVGLGLGLFLSTTN